ncbi:hypothetical protein NHX12_000925 [Muraenolepis orangiensis]|uniref:AB hydrolase-1 domain-containing protein n=1 Tax=Muraenolepis orangiensis TaxID=630683 RepID=A0A9Q0DZY4_9TELE|nr:hypothetical protein NHX12_000925 [Muraenolepis orangiensis]
MRRRTEGPEPAGEARRSESRDAVPVRVEGWRVTPWCVIKNVGMCLICILAVPPFLNFASLQREGQLLMPKGGQIVDLGFGQKMHLLCKGQGKPVVILDAPTGEASDIWFHVQESIAPLTKVCAYDRMGLGFSKRVMHNESSGTEKVWGVSTTGRMVDDLHRLLRAAEMEGPFVLVGSELGALNARFYSHVHDSYGKLLPSLQARQFSAATGLSRMFIIMGFMEPLVIGEDVAVDVVQRQKYLLSNPAHQSSAVDEHYFLNESATQVRDITRYKPLSTGTSVSVITGDSFDSQIPEHLNQMVAKLQKKFLGESYPSANHVRVGGTDRRMIYQRPSAISQHVRSVVSQRQSRHRSD